MQKLGSFFKLKGFTFKISLNSKEDKTDLNLLLRQLLNDRSIGESLKLKEELDLRYEEIMKEELVEKTNETKLISNYLNKI